MCLIFTNHVKDVDQALLIFINDSLSKLMGYRLQIVDHARQTQAFQRYYRFMDRHIFPAYKKEEKQFFLLQHTINESIKLSKRFFFSQAHGGGVATTQMKMLL